MKGSVYKRCACRVERNPKGERLACKKQHGSWFYVADLGLRLDPETGKQKRQQRKRGGFATKALAEQALAELVDEAAKGQVSHDGGQSVSTYLDGWLKAKIAGGLRPNTAVSYRHHIEDFLTPHLGHLRLRDLRPTHVEAMLAAIAVPPVKGRQLGPATVRRVHATLRSALASAKRKRLISYNPAADLDLPKVTRPKVRPWTPVELGAFLDSCAADRLSPVFETIAATGLRRGEALGLRWDDVDLEGGVIVVRQQLLQVADEHSRRECPYCGVTHKQVSFGPPKTTSGEARLVELDPNTTGVLMALRLGQDVERATWGEAYVDHGLVFAREDGQPISPEYVSKRFHELAVAAKLRPVRLHDLRHGAASLRLAAGVDMVLVSKQLGHSTLSLTSDTYSHLLPGVGRDAAERAMALVPRAGRDQLRDQPSDVADDLCDQSVTNPTVDDLAEAVNNALTCADGAPPSGLEPETLRLTEPWTRSCPDVAGDA